MLKTLLILALLGAPALAQTSKNYRKDALEVVSLQEKTVAAEMSGKSKQAQLMQRIESRRMLKFSKRYENYRPGGLTPASNALIGTSDAALAALLREKDPARKKKMGSNASKALADLRRVIGQGK